MAESLSLADVCVSHTPRGMPPHVLRNVSLSIAAGEIVGMVGPAREGRTALMRVAAGQARPESGQVKLAEIDVTRLSRSKRIRLLRGQVLWVGRITYEYFDVHEYVGLPLLACGLTMREADRLALAGLARVGALDYAMCSLASLSRWERLLVEFARAVVIRPRFLLIDDLLDDLGGARAEEAGQWLRWLVNALGCGVLLGVTNPESALVADYAWCFDQGSLTLVSKKALAQTNVFSLLRTRSEGSKRLAYGPTSATFEGTIPTQASTRIDEMPAISRFSGLVIGMYFDDHQPPHFHARSGEFSAKIRTDTLELLAGDLPRRELRLVFAWAELHASELQDNWRRARAGETLQAIEPLR